jgi:serine O-acetyltransferase
MAQANGSLKSHEAPDRYVGPLGRLKRAREALGELVDGLREDHAHIRRSEAKYGGRSISPEELPADLVRKVGFQMMAGYRLMRLLSRAGVPLAPKIASRMIRHLYGSDIHWDAEFAPGVMIVHGMGLAISPAARVGHGAIIFQHVTLGMGRHPDTQAVGAPTLEDNVHVGAGATLIGPITVGKGSKIMAGCVVVRSVPPHSIVEAPVPVVRSRLPRTDKTE